MLKRILFVLAFLLCAVPAFAARTFYVSYSSGNDSNTGVDTAHAWKTIPTMAFCGSGWNGVTITGDDTVYLKYGDTWPSTCFYWLVGFAGSSGHPVVIKGLSTWNSGDATAKPLLDLNYAAGQSGVVLQSTTPYIDFENLAVHGSTTSESTSQLWGLFAGYATHDINLRNVHIYGWRFTGTTDDLACGGAIFGNFNSVAEARTIAIYDSEIENSENSASANNGCNGTQYVYTMQRNRIHDMPSAGAFHCNFSDNLVYNISAPAGTNYARDNFAHIDAIDPEPPLFGSGTTCTYKNNISHDTGNAIPGHVYSLSHGANSDATYIYNNVFYGSTGAGGFVHIDNYDQGSVPGGSTYVLNNTFYMCDEARDTPLPAIGVNDRGYQYANYKQINNYFICGAGYIQDNMTSMMVSGTYTKATNVPNDGTSQAAATAIAQGFTQARLWRLIDTAGSIYQTGTDLSATFTTDLNGLTRTGTWNIGPYIFQTHHDYYVATDGANDQSGTITYPFLTFNKAQSVAVCGDIIYGRAGTYAAANFIGNPNNAYVECPNYDVPVTVRNYSTEHVILQPGGGIGQALDFTTDDCTPNHYWKIIASAQDKITIDCLHCQYQSNYSVRLSGNYVWLENLEVINAWQSGISAGCGHHTLVNLNVHDNGNVATSPQPHGIYASTTNMLIDGGLYHDNVAGFGIQIFASGHSDLDDNIVRNTRVYNNGASSQDNCCGGIGIFNGHRNTAYNNIVYNNAGGNAMEANFLSSAAAFYGNTVYGNTGGCVVIGSSSVTGTIFKNNICYLNGSAITDNGSGSSISNNTTANPSFTNAAGGNFTLTMGSAAIAQGADLTSLCTGLFLSLCTDFVGVARGTTPDNGAYQYASGSPASIASVVPGTGLLGQTLDVTVTGASTSFANGTTVAAFSGAGITTNSTTCSSAIICVANITIAGNTAVGYRNVTMTTDMEVVTAMSAFQVVPVPTANGGGIRLRLRIRR